MDAPDMEPERDIKSRSNTTAAPVALENPRAVLGRLSLVEALRSRASPGICRDISRGTARKCR